MFFVGFASGSSYKSIATSRRLRLQDFWARKKIGQPHNLHHVFADNIIKYLDAALLFPVWFYKIWKFRRSFHVHVSNIDPRSLGRSYGRNYAQNPFDARASSGCVLYFVPSLRHLGKYQIKRIKIVWLLLLLLDSAKLVCSSYPG